MPSFAPARFNLTAIAAGNSGPMAVRPATGIDVLRRRKEPSRPDRPFRSQTTTARHSSGSLPSLERWVARREAAARNRYFATTAQPNPGETAAWFARLLDCRFLPALEKIGFEKRLARSLMALAAPAWESMGPLPDCGSRIHPGLTRTIEEIRAGAYADSQRQTDHQELLDGIRRSELLWLAAQSAEPAGLPALFEKISAPWLILPRDYRTLSVHDALCLSVYLNCLDDDLDPGFRKTLSRVVIEYVGNFTLKYRQPALSAENTTTALFFGFAAMFWKNLRCPPAGHQDDMICDCFLQWVRRLHRKTPRPRAEMDETVAHMVWASRQIFPQPDAFGRIPTVGRYHPQASLMALRHGEPGTAAVLRTMGPSPDLYKNATAARIPYTRVPEALQSLSRTIQAQWTTESPATRRNILRFLTRLTERYRIAWRNASADGEPAASTLRFIAPRIRQMVRPLIASPV